MEAINLPDPPRTMWAQVLHAPGDLRFGEVPVPALGPGEVLVRVQVCGVCGSDPHRVMASGTYNFPTIPGHECSGIVAQVSPGVHYLVPGQRATVIPLVPCGECAYCAIGDYTVCENYDFIGSRSDGALAECVAIRAENCILLPEGLSFEEGAMVDPAAVALHAIRRAGGVEPGSDVLILGAGPIGLFAIQWCKLFGAGRVFVVEPDAGKYGLCAELGADTCLHPDRKPEEQVMEGTGGKGADLTIELAGSPQAQVQAIQCTRRLGRVVYLGISHQDAVIPDQVWMQIIKKELTLVGSINYWFSPLHHEWHTVLRFLETGRLRAAPLISHRFPLSQAHQVFPRLFAREFTYNKVMFDCANVFGSETQKEGK